MVLGNAADHLAGQVHDIALYDATPAIAKTNKFVAVNLDALQDDPANYSIQARAVSAAGENSNLHVYLCPSRVESMWLERTIELLS